MKRKEKKKKEREDEEAALRSGQVDGWRRWLSDQWIRGKIDALAVLMKKICYWMPRFDRWIPFFKLVWLNSGQTGFLMSTMVPRKNQKVIFGNRNYKRNHSLFQSS